MDTFSAVARDSRIHKSINATQHKRLLIIVSNNKDAIHGGGQCVNSH